MHKRIRKGFGEAARAAIEVLGIKKASEVVGRSQSVTYKWADADIEYFPNLRQAVELDLAVVAKSGRAPPFLTAYMDAIKYGLEGRATTALGILPESARLVNLACEVLQEIVRQTAMASNQAAPAARSMCSICANLRKLGQTEAAITWAIANDANGTICRLRGPDSANVRCSIADNSGA